MMCSYHILKGPESLFSRMPVLWWWMMTARHVCEDPASMPLQQKMRMGKAISVWLYGEPITRPLQLQTNWRAGTCRTLPLVVQLQRDINISKYFWCQTSVCWVFFLPLLIIESNILCFLVHIVPLKRKGNSCCVQTDLILCKVVGRGAEVKSHFVWKDEILQRPEGCFISKPVYSTKFYDF